jgi:hypothetical protein
MTAKDSLVNIGLAADSKQIATATKKDGSAMKTIAVLTMVFLPGTYVAVSLLEAADQEANANNELTKLQALFAMPLFNWDAENGSSVLTARFKYYWAVTIPLTFVLILIWSLLLLLPWRRWIPTAWDTRRSGGDSSSTSSSDLGSGLDNDSLADD